LTFSLKATEVTTIAMVTRVTTLYAISSLSFDGIGLDCIGALFLILIYLTMLQVSLCLLKIITTDNEAISVHRIRQDQQNVVALSSQIQH